MRWRRAIASASAATSVAVRPASPAPFCVISAPAAKFPSPTFNLVLVYETRLGQVWHCDLYRLSGPEDIVELGLEDAFGRDLVLIEWPDRLGELRPDRCCDMTFRHGETASVRHIEIGGAVSDNLAAAFARWPIS